MSEYMRKLKETKELRLVARANTCTATDKTLEKINAKNDQHNKKTKGKS